MPLQTINPATEELLYDYPELTDKELENAIRVADQRFQKWRTRTFERRAEILRGVAHVLRSEARFHAELMTEEMGKPIAQARAEVEKCAWVCEYYADHGAEFLKPRQISTDARRSFVAFQPLGVVLAVMPWNFPMWQVFRFAAPTLMAGNTALLKHAANVQGCARTIEECFRKAGCETGLFQNIAIGSDRVSEVIGHPLVRAVSLTGSVGAGRAVAQAAGKHLKKCVLELGGSDPYLVLQDANLELAASTCVESRLINSGQSCIAAKRFIVVESVRDAFVERVVKEMEAAEVGDPTKDSTDIGPMARQDLRDELHQQVRQSVDAGARCLTGGKIPKEKGAWYPPTVLLDPPTDSPAYKDELFGPVAVILTAKDEADAIRIANDSAFGLGAGIFTTNAKRGEEIATTQIEAGNVFVNAFVKSDPRLPFGGIKESGYGRELADFGIREFVNVKTVYVGKVKEG